MVLVKRADHTPYAGFTELKQTVIFYNFSYKADADHDLKSGSTYVS